ncbi:heterokaryon incompatibility protein-domain-containing protein [Plectosphaerella plurivora]|uniref:Heterokaryon incompatibility protein-domain-containing protein n=1 Tax=Plectosphaerella plurivora TaxID=936078 RepID=A0A9P8VMZ5_9PEZI|nr:heterokaryon incompatibility protein-domain-containing protein [Plectosphaerella plurivora]
MATDAERRAKQRRTTAVAGMIGRICGHVGIALVSWILDSIAHYIGRIWATTLACIVVKNGRYIPLLGLLADWCLEAPDTSFVISLTNLVVFVAQPLVFPDLDIPATEVWYEHTRTAVVTIPSYVIASLFFHYPRASLRSIRDLVLDPPGISAIAYWLWIAFACLSVPYLVHTRVLPNQSFRQFSDLFWSTLGKRLYDLRSRAGLAPQDPVASGHFSHPELKNDWDIRLLEILPRGTSSQVRCRLVTIDLDNKPPNYEAMSYTWGNPAKTNIILVNGSPVEVTHNVYNLLYDRSPMFSPRRVWIDAICINQDDTTEKAAQVRIMRTIYECASKVTIWLDAGEDSDSHLAIGLLLELSHYLKTDRPTDTELYERYRPERRSRRWLALGRILDQPYFSRMWMVQEVAVNKTLHVVYGRETIQWDTLAPVILQLLASFHFSTMIEDNTTPVQKRLRIMSINVLFLDGTRKAYQGKEAKYPPNLLHMMPRFWTFNATDGRDKVFALHGLIVDEMNPLIEPDYTKPVEVIFLRTAWYLYSQEGSLEAILYCAGIGWPRNLTLLPSWVPDWTAVGRSVISSFPTPDMGYRTTAGLQNRGPSIHGISIELDVIIIDVVGRMTREHKHRDTVEEVHDELVSWLREVRTTAEGSEEDLWRTLVCDAPSIGTDDVTTAMSWPAADVYGQWYRWCMEYILEDPEFNEGLALSEEEKYERMRLGGRWLTSTEYRSIARRFAMTKLGRMAMVPALAEEGDVVALIPGVIVPFLLRLRRSEAVSGQGVYALVGECYVHGVMAGEMADASKVAAVLLE